jgi:hypothetical protein
MGGFYWERYPDGPFATLIRIATTYLHPEADDFESLQRLAERDGDEAMRTFEAELRAAVNDPELGPGGELSRHVQYEDGSPLRSCAGCGATCTATSRPRRCAACSPGIPSSGI